MAVALAGGAILNVIFLLILGGFTVYKLVQPEETQFEAPDTFVALEPPAVMYNQQKNQGSPEAEQATTTAADSCQVDC